MNKINFLSKIIFSLKNPPIIVVTGKGRASAAEAIFQVLRLHLKIKKIKDKANSLDFFQNEILVFESEVEKTDSLDFLIKKSRFPILVVTAKGEIPPQENFFAADIKEVEKIVKLAENFPPFGLLILNFDDETVREIKNKSLAKSLTFGFQEGADFQATDIKLNTGTNFKINYKGNIVPVWLKKLFGKEQIYSALTAVLIGEVLKLNLVKVSESLKNYNSLPGKMRLIEGIKNSRILDDSGSATAFSMIEALEILAKIEGFNRKIAVLGDVIGIGKYTIEAHETIGEKVKDSADLLLTVGPRAKFIGKGALQRGMSQEKIFQFEEIEKAARSLKDEIKEGDLILVDGSKEMKMGEIVERIKKM